MASRRNCEYPRRVRPHRSAEEVNQRSQAVGRPERPPLVEQPAGRRHTHRQRSHPAQCRGTASYGRRGTRASSWLLPGRRQRLRKLMVTANDVGLCSASLKPYWTWPSMVRYFTISKPAPPRALYARAGSTPNWTDRLDRPAVCQRSFAIRPRFDLPLPRRSRRSPGTQTGSVSLTLARATCPPPGLERRARD